MQTKVNISTAILQWVLRTIQTDNLSPQIADYLTKWINGKKVPTFNQIERVSQATGIPLGYFFLQTPPQEDYPLLEYRTINGISLDRPSWNLIETIHDMDMVQSWTREHMIDEGLPKTSIVGIFNGEQSPMRCSAIVRKVLAINEDWFSKCKTADDSCRFFRNLISASGVLVMMSGIVGNNTHRLLNIDEFRAFAMIDDYAPLIFINTNDTGGGRLFSLLHEFAHVCVGESDFFNDRVGTKSHVRQVEVLCNAVAAEILAPQDIFLRKWNEHSNGSTENDIIESLGKYFKCGITVIARRALDNGLIDTKLYRETAALAIKRYSDKKRRDKENGVTGCDYYRTAAARIDRRFFQMLTDSLAEGKTQYTDAFRLTNTNRATFAKLADSQIGGVQ